MKINDVILQTVTKIVVFIILTMAVYLFVSGHNSPGGGFIGDLCSLPHWCCYSSPSIRKPS